MIDGVTTQEQIDEITGNVRVVVSESPDEKRFPTVIMRPAGGTRSEEKRYMMSGGVGGGELRSFPLSRFPENS